MSAFGKGVTQQYAGGITREFYNDRSKRKYESLWDPQFSDQSSFAAVMAPVSDTELKA